MGRINGSSADLMDERLRLIFREEFHLDDLTPRAVRRRIASFEPLLGAATSAIQLAASEVSTAFAREREPDSSIVFRLLGIGHLFRVEMSNSLTEDYLLRIDDGGERFLRRHVLDDTTDSWGVMGNGSAVVWFEKSHAVAPLDDIPQS